MIPICPITCEQMTDPYTVRPCGHTFEKKAILAWYRINPTCPLDRRGIHLIADSGRDPATGDRDEANRDEAIRMEAAEALFRDPSPGNPLIERFGDEDMAVRRVEAETFEHFFNNYYLN